MERECSGRQLRWATWRLWIGLNRRGIPYLSFTGLMSFRHFGVIEWFLVDGVRKSVRPQPYHFFEVGKRKWMFLECCYKLWSCKRKSCDVRVGKRMDVHGMQEFVLWHVQMGSLIFCSGQEKMSMESARRSGPGEKVPLWKWIKHLRLGILNSWVLLLPWTSLGKESGGSLSISTNKKTLLLRNVC